MRAVRLTGWQRLAEVCDVPAPEPGPGEVVLDVRGAGLCHSDLHLMHWPEGKVPYELPFTLGHEVAGVVAALGPGAEGVEVGEPVVVYGPWGCGRCRRCSLGEEHLCERPETVRGRGAGLGRDGGLAESMVVPSPRHLVALGDLDPVRAAPLADAGLTPYHAIRRALPLAPRAEALEAAAAAGAAVTLAADGLTPGELRRAAGRRGAELVLDFVGVDATLALAAGAIAPGGHVSVVGVGGGTFPMRYGTVPPETP